MERRNALLFTIDIFLIGPFVKKRYRKYRIPFREFLTTVFVCALPVSIVNAAPPVAFGQWSETDGEVTVNCPAGYVCEKTVSDKGIAQTMMVDDAGNRFFHLVISETDADGTVTSSESFVGKSLVSDTNASTSGIALKQDIEQSGDTAIKTNILVNTGWANDGTSSAVEIKQEVNEVTANATFDEAFAYSANRDANNNTSGSTTDIWQQLRAGQGTQNDLHEFIFKRGAGDKVTAGGSVSLPDGQTLNWQAGNDVQTTFVKQTCVTCTTDVGAVPSPENKGQTFSSQSFVNNSAPELDVYTRSIFGQSEPVWGDDPLGPPAVQLPVR